MDLWSTTSDKTAATLILQKNSELTDEQKIYIDTHLVKLNTISQVDKTISDNEISNEVEKSESIINGSSTFQNVLDLGITKGQIETILKEAMPPSNQTVKNYCIEKGIAFSEIKNKLNEMIE